MESLVRILHIDPDLGAGLEEREFNGARKHLVARVVSLPEGRLADVAFGSESEPLGLLVLGGTLLRRVGLVGRSSIEVLGAGDVLRPWQTSDDLASVPAKAELRVDEACHIAILDGEFESVLARFPSVMRQLFARSVRRANALALNLAVVQYPRVDARLLVMLWHLADRFGHVDSAGVSVPLRLSRQALAELVAASRPTVSSAMSHLAERGLVVSRGARGGWLLLGDPPAASHDLAVLSARRSRFQAA